MNVVATVHHQNQVVIEAAAAAMAQRDCISIFHFYCVRFLLDVVDFAISRESPLGHIVPRSRARAPNTNPHGNGVRMNQVHAEVDVIVCHCVWPCIPRTKKSDDFLRFLSVASIVRHKNIKKRKSGRERERMSEIKQNSEHSIAYCTSERVHSVRLGIENRM